MSFVKLVYDPMFRFCSVLDGSKTGVTVDAEKRKKYKETYNKPSPSWKQPIRDPEDKEANRLDTLNLRRLARPTRLPRFVMDDLMTERKKEYGRQKDLISQRLGELKPPPGRDEHLARPWDEFAKKATENPCLEQIRDILQNHVLKVFSDWSKKGEENTSIGNKGNSFTKMAIEDRQDILRQLSQEFVQHPDSKVVAALYDDQDVARLKASCAYIHAWNSGSKSNRFPFDVAMRSLCAIKAHAISNGTEKTVAPKFYSRMVLSKAFLPD